MVKIFQTLLIFITSLLLAACGGGGGGSSGEAVGGGAIPQCSENASYVVSKSLKFLSLRRPIFLKLFCGIVLPHKYSCIYRILET